MLYPRYSIVLVELLLEVWCRFSRNSGAASAAPWFGPGDILRGAADLGVVLTALWCSLFLVKFQVIVGAVFLCWLGAVLNRSPGAASIASGFRFKWNPLRPWSA